MSDVVGEGVGASVARRFAREGYAVGLVARNQERIGAMAAGLSDEYGVAAASRAADATDPRLLRKALAELADELGDPTVLALTPLPDVGLATTPTTWRKTCGGTTRAPQTPSQTSCG